ncbi:hypothetical protein GALMADRAFT_140967 [Galerina marginata CBS 339.88]|uniref:Uncharacterized protein n=1 Tax=Galerina marginata (strain CBS 339.88) TaxID=685588 RepID=A0A067SUN7_GALM3|nr:hypothetical protein GALMADRAFT_140967 [Galerina marginata CBS 339.88]
MPKASSIRLPRSHACHTVSTRAPLTDAQRKERSAQARQRRDEMEDEISGWKASTLTLAMDLSQRFKKKPRHLLDHLFQAGTRLVNKQGKVNPHNAFLAMKAIELRDNGETPTLATLHSAEFAEEYKNLTEAELAEITAAHESTSSNRCKRPTARARVQDISATLETIRNMLKALNMRCEIASRRVAK